MRRMTQKQRLQAESEREALIYLEAAFKRAYETVGRLPASIREGDLETTNKAVSDAFNVLSAAVSEVRPVVKKAIKRRPLIDTQHS